MCPTKRLRLGALVATLCLVFQGSFVVQSYGNETALFTVTAYYSPLPGQSRYITGSYQGDIKLNGSGVITASGKEVFPGLLAGPSNYPFGTKIYFEGYGIGEVADRGGAIVKAGGRGDHFDRIDIWMGYGDAGLDRAIRWGRRDVIGKIVIPSSEVTLAFPNSNIPRYESLRVTPESESDTIKKLQELFLYIKKYSGDIDGSYESIRDTLIDFQKETGIILSENDDGAGYFGPKTIEKIRKLIPSDTRILIEEAKENFTNYNHHKASELYKTILAYGDLEITPDSQSEEVKELQKLLRELGEYAGDIDGNYETVKNALIDFQLKIGLISRPDGWGAGYFGNQTKTALWNYYEGKSELGNTSQVSISGYSLSEKEKQTLEKVFPKLERILAKNASRQRRSLGITLREFHTKIESLRENSREGEVRAKLEYLSLLILTRLESL